MQSDWTNVWAFFVKVISPGRLINVDTMPVSSPVYTDVSAMLTDYFGAGNAKYRNKWAPFEPLTVT